MMSRLAIAAVTVLSCYGVAAKANEQINVEYNTREERIEPVVKTINNAVSYTFTIKDKKTVKWTYKSSNSESTGHYIKLNEAGIGQTVTGLNITSRARIEKNKLIFATFHDTYKLVIRVSIKTDNVCTATADFSLLPHKKYFEARDEQSHVAIKDSEYYAEGVTCHMSEVSDD